MNQPGIKGKNYQKNKEALIIKHVKSIVKMVQDKSEKQAKTYLSNSQRGLTRNKQKIQREKRTEIH